MKIMLPVLFLFLQIIVYGSEENAIVLSRITKLREGNNFNIEIIYIKPATNGTSAFREIFSLEMIKQKIKMASNEIEEKLTNLPDKVALQQFDILAKPGNVLFAFSPYRISERQSLDNYEFCFSATLSTEKDDYVHLNYDIKLEQKKIYNNPAHKGANTVSSINITGHQGFKLGVIYILGFITVG